MLRTINRHNKNLLNGIKKSFLLDNICERNVFDALEMLCPNLL